MTASVPAVSLRGITKVFGSVRANNDISLDIHAGRIKALLGENGAGKSTIMKILGGYLAPTTGQVVLDGKPVTYHSGPEGEAQGVVVIHQEFNLAPDLTVAANIFLGREITKGVGLDHAAMRAATAELLTRLDTTIRPDALIRDLSVPDRQMVEIAKALSRKARVLIMDEPSAALTHREVEALYAQVDRLRAEGVALMFCSHRLDEVSRLADRITVLRDGTVVQRALRGEMSEDGMATAMVGRELSDIFPPKDTTSGEALLEVRNLNVQNVVKDVSLTLHKGEVLGIAGLVGSGRTELAEGIVGLRPASGEIRIHGKPVNIRNPRDARDARLAYLTEDRKEAGLLLDKNLPVNLTHSALDMWGFRIDTTREKAEMTRARKDFDIRAASDDMRAGALSGGNQQKLLLAKTMLTEPEIVIIDEPTRGIDIGTKQQIYHFVRELARQGKAVIVISSELPEVIGLSDRVLVMRMGTIAGEVDGAAITEENIVRLAMGLEREEEPA